MLIGAEEASYWDNLKAETYNLPPKIQHSRGSFHHERDIRKY